jgi:prepilin-type N-terminal cleavage/methylation domain-containing protein
MRERGFTVMELAIVLAVIAILAAALTPAVLGKIRESRTAAVSQTLFGLNQAINEYKKAVTRYPSQLTLLTTRPVAGSTTDLCSNTLTAAHVAAWRGPYTSRTILSTGIVLGDVTIQNALTRVVTTAPFGELIIAANAVDTTTVNMLERELDGDVASGAAGTIRWTLIGGTPTANLQYVMPISGC